MNQLSSSINYGDRDGRITCLTYSPVRKLEGLPLDLFAHYWRDVHGPLCSRLPGLGFYVQHHFSRTYSANLWPLAPGVKPMQLVLDGAVEIGFAGASEQAQFAASSRVLFGDEFNLFGHDVAYNLPRGSRTLVDRQADGTPNGPDRLYRLHLHLNCATDPEVRTWVVGFAAGLAADPAVQKLRLHLPERYDNAHPQPPSPGVDHQVSDDRKDLVIIEIGFDTPIAARAFVESPEYRATIQEQSLHIRAQTAFLVTGVYTFVRDGKLTIAGLRGSRPAELIEQIGATNQTGANLEKIFTSGYPR